MSYKKCPSVHWTVADPIHKLMDLGPKTELPTLVALPQFQRLRRISQLGLAQLVFPGATHSRFAHSLGVAHLARAAMEQLSRSISSVSDEQKQALNDLDEYRLPLACAALLHDIGHGPFSHSFERALRRMVKGSRNPAGAPSHEDWTQKIIRSPQLQAALAEVLGEPKARAVAAILSPATANDNASPLFVTQLISSQLDMDRIDYLARDACFTGVAAGHVDTDYLLRSLRLIPHGAGQFTIGVAANGGVRSFETFAFARHAMNRSVYFHRTVATFECMMQQCLYLMTREDIVKDLRYVPPFFRSVLSSRNGSQGGAKEALMADCLEDYLQLTEAQVWAALADAASNRKVGTLQLLANNLLNREPACHLRVTRGNSSFLEQALAAAGFSDQDYALAELKSTLYNEQDLDEQVFVLAKHGEISHISVASQLVNVLRDRSETEAILVVFDRHNFERIKKVAQEAQLVDTATSPPAAAS